MRRDSSANWTTNNPILAEGEMGLELDTNKWKIGNGSNTWSTLPYANEVFSGPTIVSGNSSQAMFRITQSGSGNSFVVEDDANPDASPFVIDAAGNVGIGKTTPTTNLDVNGLVAANNVLSGYATTATSAGTTTLTLLSAQRQYFTGTTTHTVILPVTSTLSLGHSFIVYNGSTGIVTVQSSGANNVLSMPGGTVAIFTCILTSGTTAASWDAEYFGFSAVTGTGSVVLASSPTLTTPVINAISASAVSTAATLYSNITTGSVAIGGGITTGSVSIANAAPTSGTKTVNIGTAGAAGSTTVINIGSAVGTTAVSNISLSGKISRPATSQNVSAWTTSGQALDIAAATFTDTSTAAAGTVATRTLNSFNQPTLASTNAITVTDASTVYIAAAPAAGTNTTITNAYALHVAAGSVRIGSLSTAGVVTNSAAGVLSTTTSPSLSQLIIGAASTTTPVTASTYTVSATDMSIVFNTTATCTVTLPTATAGRVLMMKTIAAFAINSASSNVLPIGSGTAGTAILAATAGRWAILVGNGTNWVIMAAN